MMSNSSLTHENADQKTSVHTSPNDYQALFIGEVAPNKKSAVEQGLGCPGIGLWFHCEGALLWDPYGSLMRSVLMTVHRHPSVRTIYVVAESSKEGASAKHRPVVLGTGVSEDIMSTLHYLLRYVQGVDPWVWLQSGSDPAVAVVHSVRLLREHPLMPKSISVQGFLVEETDTRLWPMDA